MRDKQLSLFTVPLFLLLYRKVSTKTDLYHISHIEPENSSGREQMRKQMYLSHHSFMFPYRSEILKEHLWTKKCCYKV